MRLGRPPELLDNPYFRTIWERASDAMALSDADGIVVAANPAYLQLYEYKAEEVIGHSFSIIFPEQARPRVIEEYKAVFAASDASPHLAAHAADSDPYFESTVRRGDGEVRTVQSRIEYIYENHQRVAMLSIIRDITEQKQTQEALDLSETRQRLLVEIMPAAMFICDHEGLITYYNQRAAELWGRRPKLVDPQDRFCGSIRLRRTDGSPLPHHESPMAVAVLTGRSTRHEEIMMERPDGTLVVASLNIDPLYDQTGRRIGSINVFEDITNYKQAQAQLQELNATLEQRVQGRTMELERSNRELDQFAYIASHDLKAPLRAITNLAAWVSQDAAEVLPATSQEHLAKLRGRIKRMEVLMDDLLAYSRAGRKRHSPEPMNVTALIQTVVDLLAPPRGFVVKSSATIPLLRAERVPLEIVLRNLIGNAIKHHPQPGAGQVDVTVQQQGQWAEFNVKDNGSGIDPAFHEHVFEIFHTLKARDEVEGSGMGLTVVKKLVESRGGTIQIKSSVGEGATFRFTWPATAMREAVDVQTAAGNDRLNESSNNEGSLA